MGLKSGPQDNDPPVLVLSKLPAEDELWLNEVRTCPMATKQLNKFVLSSKSSSLPMFIFDTGHDFKYPVKCITV